VPVGFEVEAGRALQFVRAQGAETLRQRRGGCIYLEEGQRP
jgi:hypothetical protein